MRVAAPVCNREIINSVFERRDFSEYFSADSIYVDAD